MRPLCVVCAGANCVHEREEYEFFGNGISQVVSFFDLNFVPASLFCEVAAREVVGSFTVVFVGVPQAVSVRADVSINPEVTT